MKAAIMVAWLDLDERIQLPALHNYFVHELEDEDELIFQNDDSYWLYRETYEDLIEKYNLEISEIEINHEDFVRFRKVVKWKDLKNVYY